MPGRRTTRASAEKAQRCPSGGHGARVTSRPRPKGQKLPRQRTQCHCSRDQRAVSGKLGPVLTSSSLEEATCLCTVTIMGQPGSLQSCRQEGCGQSSVRASAPYNSGWDSLHWSSPGKVCAGDLGVARSAETRGQKQTAEEPLREVGLEQQAVSREEDLNMVGGRGSPLSWCSTHGDPQAGRYTKASPSRLSSSSPATARHPVWTAPSR